MNEGKALSTARLELIPATGPFVRAEIEQADVLSKLLGAAVPSNWPPELLVDALPFFLEQLERHPELTGWLSWYWVLRGDGEAVLVGSGGFKGCPQPDGTIEVGYSVLPQYQGYGYTTEAVSGLLSWAFTHSELACVIAETLSDNERSIRVLEKLGFLRIGTGSDPGLIRFELPRASYQKAGDLTIHSNEQKWQIQRPC